MALPQKFFAPGGKSITLKTKEGFCPFKEGSSSCLGAGSWVAAVDEEITLKEYYTIGEVSRITGVRPHTLRYWERQGKILRPARRKSRHRLYRPADIQLILELKRLREEEKLTLPAIRQHLQEELKRYQEVRHLPGPVFTPVRSPLVELLAEIRRELLALRELLE